LYILIIVALVVALIAVALLFYSDVSAESPNKVYLPFIVGGNADVPTPTPTPDPCSDPVKIESLDLSSWPYPGYSFWTLDSTDNVVVAAQVWTNLPNRDQELRKLWLDTNVPIYYIGGGYAQIWHSSCQDEALAVFDSWDLPEVTTFDLAAERTVFDPVICQTPEHPSAHVPVPEEPWLFGGDSFLVVGRNWTNWEGFDQTPWRTVYRPIETEWPLKGGGEISLFSIGCGEEAQAFYDTFSELIEKTTDQLNDEGLFAWP
jgi:hypothetical protein